MQVLAKNINFKRQITKKGRVARVSISYMTQHLGMLNISVKFHKNMLIGTEVKELTIQFTGNNMGR